MKNKFIHFLMAGALVCWSSYTLHAQTEVTDTYLKIQVLKTTSRTGIMPECKPKRIPLFPKKTVILT